MRRAWLLPLVLVACVPMHAAYLPIPRHAWADVQLGGSPAPGAHADVDLAYLAARMDPFDPARLAFYGVGRAPLPHHLVDTDEDGRPDRVRIDLPDAQLPERLTAVCPAN